MPDSSIYLVPGVRELQRRLNGLTSYIPPPPPEATESPRRILLVHAHPDPINSFSAAIANTVESAAKEAGHEIRRISLYTPSRRNTYQAHLTREEWYSRKDPGDDLNKRKLSYEVKDHLRSLQWCDTLVLVYPTWWMNTPAVVKGFFDRTLVEDIAWTFPKPQADGSSATGLVPKLTNIKDIVGVSTYGAPYSIVTLAGDNGRRMIANSVRSGISPNASVSWFGLYGIDSTTMEQRVDFLASVGSWIGRL